MAFANIKSVNNFTVLAKMAVTTFPFDPSQIEGQFHSRDRRLIAFGRQVVAHPKVRFASSETNDNWLIALRAISPEMREQSLRIDDQNMCRAFKQTFDAACVYPLISNAPRKH